MTAALVVGYVPFVAPFIIAGVLMVRRNRRLRLVRATVRWQGDDGD